MNKVSFWQAATVRAVRTMAQTFLATASTAVVLSDVNWKAALSATILAGLLSIVTSLGTGLPEVERD